MVLSGQLQKYAKKNLNFENFESTLNLPSVSMPLINSSALSIFKTKHMMLHCDMRCRTSSSCCSGKSETPQEVSSPEFNNETMLPMFMLFLGCELSVTFDVLTKHYVNIH